MCVCVCVCVCVCMFMHVCTQRPICEMIMKERCSIRKRVVWAESVNV